MIIIKTHLKELPQNCFECPYALSGTVEQYGNRYYIRHKTYHLACFLTGMAMTSTKRNRFCPLEDNE